MACGTGNWYLRHWFTINSRTGGGDPSPVCIRCGAPRPKPLTHAEWNELRAIYQSGYLHHAHVLAALSRYFGAELDHQAKL